MTDEEDAAAIGRKIKAAAKKFAAENHGIAAVILLVVGFVLGRWTS